MLSADATRAIPDATLAAIVERARRLGIPAWRVIVALGLGARVEEPQRGPQGHRPG